MDRNDEFFEFNACAIISFMEEGSAMVTGIDIGTKNIRAVMGRITADNKINVLGYGEVLASGMRRGVVADLNDGALAAAIDGCLLKIEDMSNEKVDEATVSINGAHITCQPTEGMIAVNAGEGGIRVEDLDRLASVANTSKVAPNREILDLVSHEYILDGQRGIKNPIAMNGSRLEVRASAISGLVPDCENLVKVSELANVKANKLVPAVMAAGRAVLTGQQKENGAAVIDMGATTTGLAVYTDGELQYVYILPMGVNDITNDLAKVLRVVPEVAEEIKLKFVTGRFGESTKALEVKTEAEKMSFSRAEVDEVVEARLDEIFDGVMLALRKSGFDKRLPEGVILTGGGAKMQDIEVYARKKLEMAVRIGKPKDLLGVGSSVCKPEYAAAVGLMLYDLDCVGASKMDHKMKKPKQGGGLAGIFKMFR